MPSQTKPGSWPQIAAASSGASALLLPVPVPVVGAVDDHAPGSLLVGEGMRQLF